MKTSCNPSKKYTVMHYHEPFYSMSNAVLLRFSANRIQYEELVNKWLYNVFFMMVSYSDSALSTFHLKESKSDHGRAVHGRAIVYITLRLFLKQWREGWSKLTSVHGDEHSSLPPQPSACCILPSAAHAPHSAFGYGCRKELFLMLQ